MKLHAFKKNYEDVFLYLEGNISKNASNDEIKRAKQKLFEKYEKPSQEYLRKNLFEHPSIIKSEE